MPRGGAGPIIFAPEPPPPRGWATSCGYRSLGRRVEAIGHWVKSENNGLGSPIQLCQGGGAGPTIFASEPPHV